LSERRKEAFATVADKALQYLRGDGSIGPAARERLMGKYRLFDMEQLALMDSARKTYSPVWCPLPEGGFTAIYSPGATTDSFKHWQLIDGDRIPSIGKSAVRMNANRKLKTAGRFLRLMEVGHAESVTLLFDLPESSQIDTLQLIIEGGTPVSVKPKS